MDEFCGQALRSMHQAHPELFDDKNMQKAWSKGFGEEIKWRRSPMTIEGLRIGFERASRPNGFDEPTWDDWEVEKEVRQGMRRQRC